MVSARAPPKVGLRGWSSDGVCMPKTMRPTVLVHWAVWDAATPEAIIDAGGMEGWVRAATMRPM